MRPVALSSARAGGCVRPIRLRGVVRDMDTAAGEIVSAQDTDHSPDKVMYLLSPLMCTPIGYENSAAQPDFHDHGGL